MQKKSAEHFFFVFFVHWLFLELVQDIIWIINDTPYSIEHRPLYIEMYDYAGDLFHLTSNSHSASPCSVLRLL